VRPLLSSTISVREGRKGVRPADSIAGRGKKTRWNQDQVNPNSREYCSMGKKKRGVGSSPFPWKPKNGAIRKEKKEEKRSQLYQTIYPIQFLRWNGREGRGEMNGRC